MNRTLIVMVVVTAACSTGSASSTRPAVFLAQAFHHSTEHRGQIGTILTRWVFPFQTSAAGSGGRTAGRMRRV